MYDAAKAKQISEFLTEVIGPPLFTTPFLLDADDDTNDDTNTDTFYSN